MSCIGFLVVLNSLANYFSKLKMVSLNTKQDEQPPKTPFFKGTKTSLNGNVINIKIEKKMVMYLQKRKRNCDLVI
jgi:hypothetical protein